MAKRIRGTKEWSIASVNCVQGCPHRCRYCYARFNAVRFGQCPSHEAWGTTYHRLRLAEIDKHRVKLPGRVMFPTTHDITADFLDPCSDLLHHLLAAGNEVLIVSKPHLPIIQTLCSRLAAFRRSILFRFTIGAMDDRILAYWEPGAPPFGERLSSLQLAYRLGFATSVSAEPLLDAPNALALFGELAPWISDTFWIGKMNQARARAMPGTDPREIARIEAGQTDQAVRRIYGGLAGHPQVRWKESYKSALGLDLASAPGLDQ